MLRARNLPLGTVEQVQETFAGYAEQGIDRYYLQVYAALPDIDLAEVERVYRALRH
jgi:hypothetical protein